MGNILGLIGLVVLLIGLVFIIPYKVVSKLKGKTDGVIVDMTANVEDYNKTKGDDFGNAEAGVKKRASYLKIGVGNKPMSIGSPEASMYHAVYTYYVNGKEYRKVDGLGYNKGNVKKKIGKKVCVYYNLENPRRSSLSSGKGYKYVSIGLSALGLILLLMRVVLYFLNN